MLMLLSVLGIIMYPLPMLAISIQATVMYPSYVASGQGLVIVNRYRFIFERFRANRYFFGVLYLCRNTLLSLIPVAFANYPSVQVTMLAAVMLLGMIVQMRAWPWRTKVANITDMIFSGGVVLFLVIAGPIVHFETEQDQRSYAAFISWSFCALLLVFIVAFVVVAFMYLRRRLNSEKPYKVFLTHHKGAAGSLARFIKLILSKHSSDRFFLDSDELQDLDSLFECVRAHTKFVVPLLTPALMTRPWCVGELTTAFLNRVPILPISCNGCTIIPSSRVPGILNSWTVDEFQPLLAAGINEAAIEATVEHMATLRVIEYDRSNDLEKQEGTILRIAEYCKLKRRPFVDYSSKASSSHILLLTHTDHYEALSSSMILQIQLQQHLQESVFVPTTKKQMDKALLKAKILVILLYNGILYDPAFAGMILAAYRESLDLSPENSSGLMSKTLSNSSEEFAWNRIITVSADPSFVFPGHEFYASLAAQGVSVNDSLGPEVGPLLCDAYRSVFKKISLPFSGHASIGMIEHQVKEIGKRVSAHLHGADIAGGVVRTVTGRRISTTSAERDGMQSLGLSPLDAFRSPVSMMASPWPDDEASYAYEEDEETGIRREFSDDEDLLMPTKHAHEALALPKPSDMVVHTF